MTVRRAGILLPVTALPGRTGIGDLGPGARRFLGFLSDAGQSIWQMLPVGVTNPAFGNSPYSGLGAFGLDPLLVSPEDLTVEGLVERGDVEDRCVRPGGPVAYGPVRAGREDLLRRATASWRRRASRELQLDCQRFRDEAGDWVEDLALFLALREASGGGAWTTWDAGLRDRSPRALEAVRRRLRADIDHHVRVQFLADRQWRRLRRDARVREILLVGDLPLYVAHDSVDVWCRPELFAVDAEGEMEALAGVPPDYFSATGQLWGNPTYRWSRHASEGYAWWKARMGAMLDRFDAVRFDHFRGLAAYWEVPAGARTAQKGRWVPGPGASLLEALVRALPAFSVIAEDLGVIDAEVRALMRRFDLPGMRVLQFAFGDDFPRSEHLPAYYEPDLVAYTGTHDNDTTRGWFQQLGSGVVGRRLAAWLGRRVTATDVSEVLLRLAYASVASWAVVPLQDVFGLGSSARMNRPGRARGNWTWRAGPRALGASQRSRLRGLAELYARTGAYSTSNAPMDGGDA